MSQPNPAMAASAGGDPAQGATTGDPTSDQTGQQGVGIFPLSDGTFQIKLIPSDSGSDDSDDQGDDASQGAASGAPAGGASPDDSGDDDDSSQTADNIDDALEIAGQMLDQATGASGGADGGDDNQMLSPTDAKAAWNQMAAKKDKQRAQGM